MISRIGPLLFLFLGFALAKDEPKTRHFALLTEDHGLLTYDDLERGKKIALPSAFNRNTYSPFPYWQCFSSSTIRFKCQLGGLTDEARPAACFFIIASEGAHIAKYFFRRCWEPDSCSYWRKELRDLLKREKYVCLSGAYIDEGNIEKKGSMKGSPAITTLRSNWLFHGLKVKKGSWFYFAEPGDLNYEPPVPEERPEGSDS